MEISDYSPVSFAVRGETFPYKDDLKALGGAWSPHLKGGAGWIFPDRARTEVEKFVKSKRGVPTKKSLSPSRTVAAAAAAAEPSSSSSSRFKKPVAAVSPSFRGSNRKEYQTITYTVEVPHMGQKVKIADDEETVYEVIFVNDKPPFDFAIIKDDDGNEYNLHVLQGEWVILNDSNSTDVIFT